MSIIIIKQIKSSIKTSRKQKLTLKSLGLRKNNQIVKHKYNPVILGMINVVKHLIKIESKK